MTDIWRDGAFRRDPWVIAESLDEAPADAPALVPAAALLAAPDRATGRSAPLGVVLAPDQDLAPLAPHLDRLALVALAFPKFSDGRPYSLARLLRERYGYKGEIRAVGDVLIDQIPLMRRCGVDSFAIAHAPTRRALIDRNVPAMRHHYQPVREDGEVPAGTRPWARRAA